MFDRICIAKTAWSQNYQGAPIYGRHEYVQKTHDGLERFNLLPGPDGRYYVYLPPVSGQYRKPDPADNWLLLVVAAETKDNGHSFGPLRIVGWFESARFVEYMDRPEYTFDPNFKPSASGERYSYSVVAERAYLIPVDERITGLPEMHGRKLGQASLIFLRGPNVKGLEPWRLDYAAFVEDFIKKQSPLLPTAAEVAEMGGSDSYATQEHRLRVEKAAEKLARSHFGSTHKIDDVTKENRGYDFHLTHKVDGTEILLEIKGTASHREAFFLTRNEHRKMHESVQFRLFLATRVLSNAPNTVVLTRLDMERQFDLEPLGYQVIRRG